MIDRYSNDPETAGVLAREDSYPEDAPSPEEYREDVVIVDVPRDALGWAIANAYQELLDR